MKRMGLTVAVAAAFLLGPSAAWAANKEQQLLMAELRMLQQHQQQLQQLIVAIGDAVKAVTARLDEQSVASRKALADQRLLIEGMTDNVRILRERADDTNVRLASISQELESLRYAVASQPPAAATITPGDPAADPAPGGTSAEPGAVGTQAPGTVPPSHISPQRTYESAYSDYAAGQYDLAIEGFEMFLRLFPRHLQADDARLNIGNALYNAGKYQDAMSAYQRVISDYPGTDSVPPAHYKMGLAYLQLKQPDLARRAFETVMKDHPASREQVLARQALDRLGKE